MLVGSLVYPATDGEKTAAIVGSLLTIIGFGMFVFSAMVYSQPHAPLGIADWVRNLVMFVAFIMWLIFGTMYKGLMIVKGFHVSLIGWVGVFFLIVASAASMSNSSRSESWQYLPGEEVCILVVALGLGVGNLIVDVGLLIFKAIREYYQEVKA